MNLTGSVGIGGRSVLSSAFVAPLFLLAAACGTSVEHANPKSAESTALSSSSKHGDAGTQYAFVFVDPPGSTSTRIWGINDLGTVVGSYTDADGGTHGFRRRAGSFTFIDVPGVTEIEVSTINDLDTAVGGFLLQDGTQHGFKYSSDDKMTLVDFPGQPSSYLAGINNFGDMIGGYGQTTSDEGEGALIPSVGFSLRRGTFISLPDPRGSASENYPAGINDVGTISGEFADSAGFLHGWVLRGTHYTVIDSPGSTITVINQLNDLGQAVGFDDVNGGFLLDTNTGVFTVFNCPSGQFTAARGINNRGQVAGHCPIDDSGVFHGFIATPVSR